MKETLSFFGLTLLLVVYVGFSSCSEDDAGGGNNSGDKIEFYVDGKSMVLDNLLTSYAEHTTYEDVPSKSGFSMYLYFKGGKQFVLDFYIENMNSVKKGDDITKYKHFYSDTKADLFYNTSITEGAGWYKDLPGSAVVEDIDLKNQIIVIKLDEVKAKCTDSNDYSSGRTHYHVLNANIKMHYDIEKMNLY
jgi:hypothetical protein